MDALPPALLQAILSIGGFTVCVFQLQYLVKLINDPSFFSPRDAQFLLGILAFVLIARFWW